MYFEANQVLTTEQIGPDGTVVEGTYQDHGIIATIHAETLSQLRAKLFQTYNLANAEIDEDRIEMSFETDGFIETYTIYLSCVVRTPVDATEFLKGIAS
jgi:hypothetical protein